MIDELELNRKIFEFLKENLTLDTDTVWGGNVYLKLKLTNPETGVQEEVGYNYITIKEGEGYY